MLLLTVPQSSIFLVLVHLQILLKVILSTESKPMHRLSRTAAVPCPYMAGRPGGVSGYPRAWCR